MDGATALSCRAVVSFAEDAHEVAESLGVALCPYTASGERVFNVLVNAQAARVTHLSPPDETPIWTLVRRETGYGAFWDYGTRRIFEVTSDEVAPTPVTSAAGVDLRVRSRGDVTHARVRLQDAAAGMFRLELGFGRGSDLGVHGPALLWLLYGGRACHRNSGWPLKRLEKLGCLAAARLYRGSDEAPLCTVDIRGHRIERVGPKDFEPPRDFRRRKRRPGAFPQEKSAAPSGHEPAAFPVLPEDTTRIPLAALRRGALPERHDQFTPDCMGGSTRFGSVAALLHQDALNHAQTLINTVAPFLGKATLSGTTITVDWLSTLAAIRGTGPASSATAAGSGLFCFLRFPRTPAGVTSSGTAVPASGGTGLLDKIAVSNLTGHAPGEPSYLEREVATGVLSETMRRRWGVTTTALISAIFAADGDFAKLTTAERIAIAEAYETSVLGKLQLDVPVPEEFDVPKVVSGRLTSLTGTMNFGGLGGASLVPLAEIGSSGNITIGVTLPPTTVTATVAWKLALEVVGAGDAIAVAGCFLLPFLCPAAAIAAATLTTALNDEVEVFTASTSGGSIMLDVRYEWDVSRGVVGPTVDVLSTTGAVTVLPSATTWPAHLAGEAVLIINALASWLNGWTDLLALALAKALESALRDQGLELPAASEPGLSAVSGSALSVPGSYLLLGAELTTDPATGSQPYATQVPDAESIGQQLQVCHTVMRAATTPAPPAPSPQALYAGLAPSQNALNHYLGARWRQGAFTADYPLGPELTRLLALAPAGASRASVVAVHAWPASCPRVEIAEAALAAQDLPLVAFFDDLRICFQGLPSHNSDRPDSALFELSVNVKTRAAVTLAGPFIPRVLFDASAASIEISDARVGELVDPNLPVKAATVDLHLWEPLAQEVARVMLAEHDAGQLQAPPPPIPWVPPIPLGQPHELIHLPQVQLLPPQAFYLELLGRRRAVYLVPVVRTGLLELVDGSRAPTLNALLGTTGVSLSSLTCSQGLTLRSDLSAVLADFVVPP
jgi:hypothetical protein